jgi:hypothetical protein
MEQQDWVCVRALATLIRSLRLPGQPEAMALVSWPHAMAEPALRTADFWHRT